MISVSAVTSFSNSFSILESGSFNLLIFLTMPRCIPLGEIPLPYLPLSLDLHKLHLQIGKSAEVAMELSEHNPGVSSLLINSILFPCGSLLKVIVPSDFLRSLSNNQFLFKLTSGIALDNSVF